MICAAIVLAILSLMYWGACYFFRSCRGNKAFRDVPDAARKRPEVGR